MRVVMNSPRIFSFILAIFYALSTSGLVAERMVYYCSENQSAKYYLHLFLLVIIAALALTLGSMFRNHAEPVLVNNVAVVSFSAIYVIAAVSDSQWKYLILPFWVVVGFLCIPSYQQWLRK